MGKPEPLGLELDLAEQEQVDVERARPVAGAAEEPALLDLDRLADVEQLLGLELRPDPHGGVEEVGLLEDLADGLCLIGGGDGLDLDSVLAQRSDGGTQVTLPVAEVRAQAQVAGPQSDPSPSSSSSGPTPRSWVTSTATSSIATGSGGSGFEARTRADSQP